VVNNRLLESRFLGVLLLYGTCCTALFAGGSSTKPVRVGFAPLDMPDIVSPRMPRQAGRRPGVRPGFDPLDMPDIVSPSMPRQAGRHPGVLPGQDSINVPVSPVTPKRQPAGPVVREGVKVGSRGVVARRGGSLVVRQADGEPFYRTFDASGSLPVDVRGKDGKLRRISPETQHDLRKFRAKQDLAKRLETLTGQPIVVDLPENPRMRELIDVDIRPGTVPEEHRAWEAGKWRAFSDQFIDRVENEFGVRLTPQEAAEIHKHAERFPILYLEDWDVKGGGPSPAKKVLKRPEPLMRFESAGALSRPAPEIGMPLRAEPTRIERATGTLSRPAPEIGVPLRAEPVRPVVTTAELAAPAAEMGAPLRATPTRRVRPKRQRPVETVAEETVVPPARVAEDLEVRVKPTRPEILGGVTVVTEGGVQRPGAAVSEPARVQLSAGELALPGVAVSEPIRVGQGKELVSPGVAVSEPVRVQLSAGELASPGVAVSESTRVELPKKPVRRQLGKRGKAGMLAAGAGLAGVGIAALADDDDEGAEITVDVTQKTDVGAASGAGAAGAEVSGATGEVGLAAVPGIVSWLADHCIQFNYGGVWWEIRPDNLGGIAILSPDMPDDPITPADFTRISGVPIKLTEDGRVFVGLHGGAYVTFKDGSILLMDAKEKLISPSWLRVLGEAVDVAT